MCEYQHDKPVMFFKLIVCIEFNRAHKMIILHSGQMLLNVKVSDNEEVRTIQ